MIATTSVRRRLVGRAVREYRQNLGFNLEDAARILDCDRSKVSRIETGQRGIRAKELRELLTEFGVEEQAQSALATMASPRGAASWSRAYAEVLPDTYRDYLTMEMAASQIFAYDALLVPGLLQTRDYAHAVITSGPTALEAHAAGLIAEATQVRQQEIASKSRPHLTIVIGEAALRQVIGGPEVMRAQITALAEAAGKDSSATIQVVPFERGAEAAALGLSSLTILRFSGAPRLGVVHLPGASGGVCLEGSSDLAAYSRAFELLRICALSPEASGVRLREMAAG